MLACCFLWCRNTWLYYWTRLRTAELVGVWVPPSSSLPCLLSILPNNLNVYSYPEFILHTLSSNAIIYLVSQTRNLNVVLKFSNSLILCIQKSPSFSRFTNYFSNLSTFHHTYLYHFSTCQCNFLSRLLYQPPIIIFPQSSLYITQCSLNKFKSDSLPFLKPSKAPDCLCLKITVIVYKSILVSSLHFHSLFHKWLPYLQFSA